MAHMNHGAHPLTWYYEIPVVSRTYLSAAAMTTVLVTLDIISPFFIYFNWTQVSRDGQLWRLITNFLYFGPFSLDFLFHMYFLVRYSRLLEEGEFRGRTADFVFMLFFGGAMMTAVNPWLGVEFLASSLTFMMVYVWGRRNEHVRMSFLGLFPFTAPYLPWVLLCFSLILRNPLITDAIGIVVGHIYYFLEFVYPEVAAIRGWRVRKIIRTPGILNYLCGGQGAANDPYAVADMQEVVDAFVPANFMDDEDIEEEEEDVVVGVREIREEIDLVDGEEEDGDDDEEEDDDEDDDDVGDNDGADEDEDNEWENMTAEEVAGYSPQEDELKERADGTADRGVGGSGGDGGGATGSGEGLRWRGTASQRAEGGDGAPG